MNDGSPLYRARFQWQPTLTAHDPDNILTLENAPVVYTATGDVALTFAVASPLTVTYAEPVATALTFAVSSPQTATYAEPVSIAITFGVDSAFEYIAGSEPVDYSVTGDVALSFGVESPFEYVPAPVVVVVSSGGGGRPVPYRPAPPPPVVFVMVGSVTFPAFSVASAVSVSYAEPAGVRLGARGVASRMSVTYAQGGRVLLAVPTPRSSRSFHLQPGALSAAEELVLLTV